MDDGGLVVVDNDNNDDDAYNEDKLNGSHVGHGLAPPLHLPASPPASSPPADQKSVLSQNFRITNCFQTSDFSAAGVIVQLEKLQTGLSGIALQNQSKEGGARVLSRYNLDIQPLCTWLRWCFSCLPSTSTFGFLYSLFWVVDIISLGKRISPPCCEAKLTVSCPKISGIRRGGKRHDQKGKK